MTTKEHVYELVELLDTEGLDVERLNEDQLSALEYELASILLRFGRRDESDDDPEVEAVDDRDERPYDPLGSIIGRFSSGDGITDVSSNIHKYVADAIKHW